MKKYKTIMELIFIFILPLILILSGINLKENQITTNNGYEWNTYIEYNNKILIDTNGYKNVINNFNMWDEDAVNGGYINNNGAVVTGYNAIASRNLIKVNPNETIYFKVPYNITNYGIRIAYYDANQTFIRVFDYYTGKTITTDNNVEYIRFNVTNVYGNTYNHDININKSVSWANGNYVPYGEPLIIYSQTDISGQNDIVYTPFGIIKNLIINNLKLQQNTTTDILFDYTILWFLMFILWHVLYLFFDMLIHLFVDWGHKEREKVNG